MSYGYIDKTGKISYYVNPLESVSPNQFNGGYLGADQTGLGGFLSFINGKNNSAKMQDDGYQFFGDNGWLKPTSGLLMGDAGYGGAVDPMQAIASKYTQAPQSSAADPLTAYRSFKSAQAQGSAPSAAQLAQTSGGK